MQETTTTALDALFARQKAAFKANNNPGYEQRMAWLQALERMMVELRVDIQNAVAEDFSVHSPMVTDIFETGGVLGRNRYIQACLQDWMAPDARPLPPEVHGSSSCEVILQPQGVMGNISPWNFPIECSLVIDRKSTRLNSSHDQISYAVFCLKKKKKKKKNKKENTDNILNAITATCTMID